MITNTLTDTQSDASARERALDPTQSFIVQAPAGSGKTELLTQRFLVLLDTVTSPEEILAITFTKKAANEMRARIINTLNKAVASPEPELEHAKKTWHLARNVLQRDKEYQWHLLENPNRLRIQTIDSFNASLTKYLPILSQFGATPEITDQPASLYAEAVEEFLTHLEEDVAWSDAIAELLLHMDNDLNRVQNLLVEMLAKRDQWLPHITLNANNPVLRDQLEKYLQHVITDTLEQLHHTFPKELQNELCDLVRHAANNLLATDSDSCIVTCHDLAQLPGIQLSDLSQWLGIADFLLKKDHQWRKTFTKSEGILAPGKSIELKEIKDRALALVEQLTLNDTLRQIFEDLRTLPSSSYSEPQWQILQALQLVLQVVVAQLRLTFQKYGKIDFIENVFAANTALGDEETPTDLALALDYRIQHMLVDEFQDTANTQYRLIKKLTAGWMPGDGKTLFVVGDPMQSIYRFREAEVGLFIRARKYGIHPVYLEPLRLSVNFRSSAGIVHWVNQHFKQVLPIHEDIATGAVSYSMSIASKTTSSMTEAVELHSFIKENPFQEQAHKIIDIIQQSKKDIPNGTVAILVRTRGHLKAIIPALKAAQLAYRAIKIDPLNLRPTIQDLMGLTRALLHPADRIAWLTVLRAPWCGLTLSDLLQVSGQNPNELLWKRLQSKEVLASLSNDGQTRLSRILPVLFTQVSERKRQSLRQWVESTWLLIGGPACCEQLSDLDDASAYFDLLEQLDDGGELSQIDKLDDIVKSLFAAPDNQADQSLQIMTIHNAKGLEFDTVILPHLERKPSNDDKQLLLWMQRPRDIESNDDLIFAPVHAIGDDKDSVYEYIKRQIKIKSRYEDGRLLYVAATRAKQKLHLLFSLNPKTTKEGISIKPAAGSLLEKLWPSIEETILSQLPTDVSIQETDSTISHNENSSIHRLVSGWQNPISENHEKTAIAYHQKSNGFLLPDFKPRIIGTLLHEILQQLARYGSSWWINKTLAQQESFLKNQLITSGMIQSELADGIHVIQQGIQHIFQDPRGQWILKSHSEAQSELPITTIINNEIKSLVIDRTFVDENNIRWIIDYKTSILNHDDLDTFLNAKKSEYEQQLWQYQQAIQHIDSRPIRVGLYFPLIPAWKEWAFD